MIAPIETSYGGKLFRGYRFAAAELPQPAQRRVAARSNLAGRRFGRLVVVEELGIDLKTLNRWWGCECDCGVRLAVRGPSLRVGHTSSCGCLAKEQFTARNKARSLPPGEASFRSLYAIYKANAASRGRSFELTQEEFRRLTKGDCAYCGLEPLNAYRPGPTVNGAYLCNGVDRFDNAQGYTSANSRSCCSECNLAKGRMKATRWIAWLTRISLRRAPGILDRDGAPILVSQDRAA